MNHDIFIFDDNDKDKRSLQIKIQSERKLQIAISRTKFIARSLFLLGFILSVASFLEEKVNWMQLIIGSLISVLSIIAFLVTIWIFRHPDN